MNSRWSDILKTAPQPLVLPCAHDALTAKLIECAGFPAYQIGGFALVGARHALPDIDLNHLGDKARAVRQIIAASGLPVLVDCDDGYGDARNVTYTVETYARLNVDAIFIEDQRAPASCGHLAGKAVIPVKDMCTKIKAAVAAKPSTLFLLARTDAIAAEDLDSALARGHQYLEAGADGIYVEGPVDSDQLQRIGAEFKDVPLATSILENGGRTPWLPPKVLAGMGFNMVLYPTTVLFQVVATIQEALVRLQNGEPMPEASSFSLDGFEDLVDIDRWRKVEKIGD